MKVCRVFLAALSTVALFYGSLTVAAPGTVSAPDAAQRLPAIAQELAQNRPQQPPRQRQPLPCPVQPLLRPESPSPLRQLSPRPQQQPQRPQQPSPRPQPQPPSPRRQSPATQSSPRRHVSSPSGVSRTPAAQGASVVRLDCSQPQGDNIGASGLVQSRLGEHHWGYGWHVGHRPGDFHRLPPVPRQSHIFQHWDYLYDRSQFTMGALPRELRVMLRSGQSMSFQVEEDMTSGYRWIANYDRRRCTVEIMHRITPQSELILPWSNATGTAEVVIHARATGLLVIDLVYAKPQEWANGVPPAKVAQVFLQVAPR